MELDWRLQKYLQKINLIYLFFQDQKKILLQQLRDKKEEEQRIQRLQQFENQAFSTYDKIHQRLLNR